MICDHLLSLLGHKFAWVETFPYVNNHFSLSHSLNHTTWCDHFCSVHEIWLSSSEHVLIVTLSRKIVLAGVVSFPAWINLYILVHARRHRLPEADFSSDSITPRSFPRCLPRSSFTRIEDNKSSIAVLKHASKSIIRRAKAFLWLYLLLPCKGQ